MIANWKFFVEIIHYLFESMPRNNHWRKLFDNIQLDSYRYAQDLFQCICPHTVVLVLPDEPLDIRLFMLK